MVILRSCFPPKFYGQLSRPGLLVGDGDNQFIFEIHFTPSLSMLNFDAENVGDLHFA
jgi:hypothetical protein